SQRDFYSLFAFFQNIDESGQTVYFGEVMPVPTMLLSTAEQDAKLAALKKKIVAKENELATLRQQARGPFEEWLGVPASPGKAFNTPAREDSPKLESKFQLASAQSPTSDKLTL